MTVVNLSNEDDNPEFQMTKMFGYRHVLIRKGMYTHLEPKILFVPKVSLKSKIFSNKNIISKIVKKNYDTKLFLIIEERVKSELKKH